MNTALVPATDAHLAAMTAWFSDAAACRFWAGDAFRFPFTAATFREDTKVDALPSRVLVDEAGRLLAFGQYYERHGRCHLGRLAVSPSERGRGLGRTLVVALVREGAAALGASEASLFVLPENTVAARLYAALGFRSTPYPGNESGTDAFDYLVVPAARIVEAA